MYDSVDIGGYKKIRVWVYPDWQDLSSPGTWYAAAISRSPAFPLYPLDLFGQYLDRLFILVNHFEVTHIGALEALLVPAVIVLIYI
jgi:hypothetical protein